MGSEQTVRPYAGLYASNWGVEHTGRAELTAVFLRRPARAENLGISIGLEGVEGAVMLGDESFREALEKHAPVQDAPVVREASEST